VLELEDVELVLAEVEVVRVVGAVEGVVTSTIVVGTPKKFMIVAFDGETAK
jgi:hypothetical protein